MAIPGGPNQGGGLPNRPGLPQRPGAGNLPKLPVPQTPAKREESNSSPQQAANAALRDALMGGNELPSVSDVSQNDRLSQYDFDGQRSQRSEFSQQSLEDLEKSSDEPEEITAEEARRLEEARIRKEKETADRFERSMADKTPTGKIKNNVLKPQSGELDRKGQNAFIDKNGKKLKPFGGKKSAMKQSDVDSRKNLRQTAKAVQIVVIGLLILVLGFGVKNAFFPPQSLTQADVQSIVYNTTGSSAFPLERGKVFAESFMSAYMNYDPAGGNSTAVLQYFTIGKLVPKDLSYPGLSSSKNYQQTMIYGPLTYQSQPAGNNSAIYTIGALVQVSNTTGTTDTPATETSTPTTPTSPDTSTGGTTNADGTAPNTDAGASPDSTAGGSGTPDASSSSDQGVTPGTQATTASGDKLMWQFFAVNVYYDTKADSFAIAGWPNLVPTPSAMKSSDVPADIPPGTGTAASPEVLDAIRPTIYGFLEAYRVSSGDNYDKLLPYLANKPTPDLLKGLNSEYVFKSGAADDNSVVINTYTTDIPTEWKASLTVTWTQNVGDAKADFMSTYIMTIDKVADGYRVVKFAPTVYTPKE